MEAQTATQHDQAVFLLQVFEMAAQIHFLVPVVVCSPTGWLLVMAFYSDEEHADPGQEFCLTQGENDES